MKGALQTTTEAYSQGLVDKRLTGNLRSKSILDVYQDEGTLHGAEQASLEALRKLGNFRELDKKDPGLFLLFEHENEAQELLTSRWSQTVLAELLEERDVRVPCFFGFDTLDGLSRGRLGERLFSLQALCQAEAGRLDMQTLKRLMLRVIDFRLTN